MKLILLTIDFFSLFVSLLLLSAPTKCNLFARAKTFRVQQDMSVLVALYIVCYLMTDKIRLSELDKKILKEFATKRITCSRSIYVDSRDLARLLKSTHNQSFIWSLKRFLYP